MEDHRLKPAFCFLCGKDWNVDRPGPEIPAVPIIGRCCQHTAAAEEFRKLCREILVVKGKP